MTHGAGSASLVLAMGEQVPDCFTVSGENELNGCQPIEVVRVGEQRLGLTPEQRRAAIERAGCAMEAAMHAWKLTHEVHHLNRAYRHLEQMRQLSGLQPRSEE